MVACTCGVRFFNPGRRELLIEANATIDFCDLETCTFAMFLGGKRIGSETCEALAVPLHHPASACCSGGGRLSPLQNFPPRPSRTSSTINNRPCRFVDSVIVTPFFFCCFLSSGHPSFLSVVHHTPSIACFSLLPCQ